LTPLPLDRLRFGWRSHLSALWWLGLLYRCPRRFREVLEILPKANAIGAGFLLLATAVPYIAVINILFGLPVVGDIYSASTAIAGGIARGIAIGIAGGIAVGIAEGIAVGIASGIALGIALGIAFGIAGGIAEFTGGIALGITGVIASGIAFGIAGVIAEFTGGIALGIALGITFGVAGGITFGIASGIAFGVAFGIAVSRAYYLPFHAAFVWPVPQARWYCFHPVAWDDLCSVPFPGLDRLLVAFVGYAGEIGRQEVDRLIDNYPRQRTSALRARAILLAHDMGGEPNLAVLDAAAARLPQGERRFLADVPKLRDMIAEIAARQRQLDTVHRPFLREPLAQALRTQIENFSHQIAGFREPLASEFRAAGAQWLAIADGQWREAEAVVKREPIAQVFRAGDPVDRAQEAFIPRLEVIGELESQLMLATGCPGLVLYGRRRTGKSTALKNLDGFLPPEVAVTTISMQDPAAFTSLAHFARLVASAATGTTPGTDLTLTDMFDELARANAQLADQKRRLLLAVDEYETIDEKIGSRVFTLDLLATLRESIQAHRRITWIFAGSHDIAELTHAPWPSYLVSARTIEMLLFSETETRLLLTEPMSRSSLWSSEDERRPRFPAGFWGDGGVEHIHREAGGWPHLVQLLAETTVDLVNDSGTREADAALLERASARAIVRGDTVLRQLLERECTVPGEWDYIAGFRRNDA
jgi:hypothetical protein